VGDYSHLGLLKKGTPEDQQMLCIDQVPEAEVCMVSGWTHEAAQKNRCPEPKSVQRR
jgi:hypothetical protein